MLVSFTPDLGASLCLPYGFPCLGITRRLPTLDDRPALPYTWAVYQECLRWGVVTPCQYHVARDEDVYDLGSRGRKGSAYNQVRIPKDTLVIVNTW